MKMKLCIPIILLLLTLTGCSEPEMPKPLQQMSEHDDLQGPGGDRIRSFAEQEKSVQLLADGYNLPLKELTAKWNSLALSLGVSDLQLRQEQLQIMDGAGTFNIPVTRELMLSGSSDQEENITRLECRASSGYNDRMELLTVWALVIASTTPDTNPSEVDSYFEQLGIEPATPLQQLVGRQILIQDGMYRIGTEGNNLTFLFEKTKNTEAEPIS